MLYWKKRLEGTWGIDRVSSDERSGFSCLAASLSRFSFSRLSFLDSTRLTYAVTGISMGSCD